MGKIKRGSQNLKIKPIKLSYPKRTQSKPETSAREA